MTRPAWISEIRSWQIDGVSDHDRLVTAEIAAYRLLEKFHRETDCGGKGMGGLHWAECERLVDAFGWVSWEAWQRVAQEAP